MKLKELEKDLEKLSSSSKYEKKPIKLELAQKYNCGIRTIERWNKRYLEKGINAFNTSKAPINHPNKVSDFVKLQIFILCYLDLTEYQDKVATIFQSHGHTVSEQTVKREFKKLTDLSLEKTNELTNKQITYIKDNYSTLHFKLDDIFFELYREAERLHLLSLDVEIENIASKLPKACPSIQFIEVKK